MAKRIKNQLFAAFYQAYSWGFCLKPRPRGLFVKSPLGNPEKQRLTFIIYQDFIYSLASY